MEPKSSSSPTRSSIPPIAPLLPDPRELLHARRTVERFLKPTPLLSSERWGGNRFGTRAWLKLEVDQEAGSYKVRGLLSWLGALAPSRRREGLRSISRGRHGLASAYAARAFGVPAHIGVREDAPSSLVMMLEALSADVRFMPPPEFEAELALQDPVTEPGLAGPVVIHPRSLDPWTAAGSGGTMAHEILEALPTARRLVVPEEHGGLLAGMAAALLERGANVSLTAVRCAGHPEVPKFGVPGIRRVEVLEEAAIEAAGWGWESLGVSLDRGSAAVLAWAEEAPQHEEVVLVLGGTRV